ncbi:MAG TPA: DsbA family protein [Kofleriaceae bacterium]|nr:DsbA family protein [Kofleriaceae bacterium]
MLELWFDFSCPYAYLASRRARHLGVDIDWRPMLLGGVFRGIGAGDGPMATLSPAKARHNLADMHRWAEVFGEPFQMPAAHPMRTVRALRVLLALPHSRWPDAIEALYAAYWQRAEDITSDDVIAAALRRSGMPEADIASALAHADDHKDELRRRTDEAIALGIFGAPGWVKRRPDGSAILVWGQDRMPWIDAICAGWDPDAGPPPGGPRPFAFDRPAADGATLDVYFDVSSPFAYLALTQLPAIAAMGVTPQLVPILLGALFRDIGQANVPLLAMPPAKLRYISSELYRWSRWWGVPFSQPTKFPQRTVTAQRLALLAAESGDGNGFERGHRLALALGRAMWAEDRDLEDDATLRTILDQHGFSPSLVERTQDPAIKARLAANTAAAREAGVFGVPTMIVNGTHLFWGQDRLDHVARCLAGWTPRFG